MTCISRKRHGRGYAFYYSNGTRVSDPNLIKRLSAIGVPPTYTNTCFSRNPRAKVQATAKDANGKTQYWYHSQFVQKNKTKKFDRMLRFGEDLPRIRSAVKHMLQSSNADIRADAMALQLMDKCYFRPGNRKYTKKNGSYGATTLSKRHITFTPKHVHISFPGKSGVQNTCTVHDRSLRKALRKNITKIRGSSPVALNMFLAPYTSKDLRTWGANALFIKNLRRSGIAAGGRSRLTKAIQATANALGNTPSVCKKHYIDPRLIEMYKEDSESLLANIHNSRKITGLSRSESALLHILL